MLIRYRPLYTIDILFSTLINPLGCIVLSTVSTISILPVSPVLVVL